MKQFKKENAFPNEAFVQASLEKYFVKQGYRIEADEKVDLIACKGNEKWVVEAKGLTSAPGLDFNTCVGQIVKSMLSENTKYAIAIPKHPKYEFQCSLVPSTFRERNNLYFLIVDETENVKVVEPTENLEL